MKKTTHAKVLAKIKQSGAKGNAKASLIDLFCRGYAVTGQSGYSKGWSNKRVWTPLVKYHAHLCGLNVTSGNNAPKGGANGEFVKLHTDKRKNPLAWRMMAIITRYQSIRKARAERTAKEWAAQKDAIAAAIEAESAVIMPHIDKQALIDARELAGAEKSNTQRRIFIAALQKIGNPDLSDFWEVFRAINSKIS